MRCFNKIVDESGGSRPLSFFGNIERLVEKDELDPIQLFDKSYLPGSAPSLPRKCLS